MVAYTKPQQRKKEECEEKREISSSLLILDLKGIIIVTILPKKQGMCNQEDNFPS